MEWCLILAGRLFPAYAGVILRLAAIAKNIKAFPRLRGGDPF